MDRSIVLPQFSMPDDGQPGSNAVIGIVLARACRDDELAPSVLEVVATLTCERRTRKLLCLALADPPLSGGAGGGILQLMIFARAVRASLSAAYSAAPTQEMSERCIKSGSPSICGQCRGYAS